MNHDLDEKMVNLCIEWHSENKIKLQESNRFPIATN